MEFTKIYIKYVVIILQFVLLIQYIKQYVSVVISELVYKIRWRYYYCLPFVGQYFVNCRLLGLLTISDFFKHDYYKAQ